MTVPAENMPWLLAMIDAAKVVLILGDYVTADRIRDEIYSSGYAHAWFAADLVGDEIARRREQDRPKIAIQGIAA
jgi:hypothetical protein